MGFLALRRQQLNNTTPSCRLAGISVAFGNLQAFPIRLRMGCGLCAGLRD